MAGVVLLGAGRSPHVPGGLGGRRAGGLWAAAAGETVEGPGALVRPHVLGAGRAGARRAGPGAVAAGARPGGHVTGGAAIKPRGSCSQPELVLRPRPSAQACRPERSRAKVTPRPPPAASVGPFASQPVRPSPSRPAAAPANRAP